MTPSKREMNRNRRIRNGLTDSLIGPRRAAKEARKTLKDSLKREPNGHHGLPERPFSLPQRTPRSEQGAGRNPEDRNPGGRPKRGRSADRRMRPRGVQGFGPKTAKMPVFAVFRRRPSLSRVQWKRFACSRDWIRGAVPLSEREARGQ